MVEMKKDARIARIPRLPMIRVTLAGKVKENLGKNKGLLNELEQIDISIPIALPPMQEIFCRRYIQTMNAPRAVREAFNCKQSSVSAIVSQMMNDPNVLIRLAQLWNEYKKHLRLEPHELLEEMGIIIKTKLADYLDEDGLVTPKNLLKMDTRAIKSLTTKYDKDGRVRYRVELFSKEKMIELYGKYHKMFSDTVNVEGEVTHKVQKMIIGGQPIEFN